MKAYCVFLMEESGPEHYMEIDSERLLKIFDSKEKAISYIEEKYSDKVDREQGMLILKHGKFAVLGEKNERITYVSISEMEIE